MFCKTSLVLILAVASTADTTAASARAAPVPAQETAPGSPANGSCPRELCPIPPSR